MDYKIIAFKWLLYSLALVCCLTAFFSWVDALVFYWPATISGWIPLLSTTALSFLLIKVCFIDWDGIAQQSNE